MCTQTITYTTTTTDYTRGIAAKHIKRGYTLVCQWAGPALLLPVAASFAVSEEALKPFSGRQRACVCSPHAAVCLAVAAG